MIRLQPSERELVRKRFETLPDNLTFADRFRQAQEALPAERRGFTPMGQSAVPWLGVAVNRYTKSGSGNGNGRHNPKSRLQAALDALVNTLADENEAKLAERMEVARQKRLDAIRERSRSEP